MRGVVVLVVLVLATGLGCGRDGAGRGLYAFVLQIDGAGSVTSDPAGIACPPTCEAVYHDRTVLRLTATSDPGGLFGSWGNLDNACTTATECVITIDSHKSGTAVFQSPLTVAQGAGGFGRVISDPSGIDCPTTCTAHVDPGTRVLLTPENAATAFFTGWGAPCGAETVCVVDIDKSPAIIDANFAGMDWRGWGGPDDERITGTTVYRDGTNAAHTIFTGTFRGTLVIGNDTLTSTNNSDDIFVAWVNPDGSVAWANSYGGNADDVGGAPAVDATGNVWINGSINDTIDWGGGTRTVAGATETFLLKLDQTGAHQFSAVYGGNDTSDNARGTSMFVDTAGNVYQAGFFEHILNLGGSTFTTTGAADEGVFVAKYDTNGSEQWSVFFEDLGGTTELNKLFAMTVDTAGNVIVTGEFQQTLDVGGIQLTSAGGLDGFVAKLDTTNGNTIWAERFGGLKDARGTGVAVDASNHVLLAGTFHDSIDFGSGPMASGNQNSDLFLVMLNTATGAQEAGWPLRVFGDSLDDQNVSLTSNGTSLYMAGTTFSAFTIDGQTMLSNGGTDMFVAEFSLAEGSLTWAGSFGGIDNDEAFAIAPGQGTVVVTGQSASTLEVGNPARTNQGGMDLNITVITP